jgi:nitrogen fixation-related uncharacterized protein
MSVDMFLVLVGIFAILWGALHLALTHGRTLVMLVFTLGVIGLFMAYQSAQADDVQVFAGVELHNELDVSELVNELEDEYHQGYPASVKDEEED